MLTLVFGVMAVSHGEHGEEHGEAHAPEAVPIASSQ
jgi:hypothetical protein